MKLSYFIWDILPNSKDTNSLYDFCATAYSLQPITGFHPFVLKSGRQCYMRPIVVTLKESDFVFNPNLKDYSFTSAFCLHFHLHGPGWLYELESKDTSQMRVLSPEESKNHPTFQELLETLVFAYIVAPTASGYDPIRFDPFGRDLESKMSEHIASPPFAILCWVRSTMMFPASLQSYKFHKSTKWIPLNIHACAISNTKYRNCPDAAYWLLRKPFIQAVTSSVVPTTFFQDTLFPFLREWIEISFFAAHIVGSLWSFACNVGPDDRNCILYSHEFFKEKIPLVEWNKEKKQLLLSLKSSSKSREEKERKQQTSSTQREEKDGGDMEPYVCHLSDPLRTTYIWDYVSFYPSNIIKHQLYPLCPPEITLISPNVWAQKMKRIFLKIMRYLVETRRGLQNRQSTFGKALKLIANTAYGCTSNLYFRFFCPDFARKVERIGRQMFRLLSARVKQIAASHDIIIIGGSTDSLILSLPKHIPYTDVQHLAESLDLPLSLECSPPLTRICIFNSNAYATFQQGQTSSWIFKGLPQVSKYLPMVVRNIFETASKLVLMSDSPQTALESVANFFCRTQATWRKQWLKIPLSQIPNVDDWVFWIDSQKHERSSTSLMNTIEQLMPLSFLPSVSQYSQQTHLAPVLKQNRTGLDRYGFSFFHTAIKNSSQVFPVFALRDCPEDSSSLPTSSTFTSGIFAFKQVLFDHRTHKPPPTVFYPVLPTLQVLKEKSCIDLAFYWKHFVFSFASQMLNKLWQMCNSHPSLKHFVEDKYFGWSKSSSETAHPDLFVEDTMSFQSETIFTQQIKL